MWCPHNPPRVVSPYLQVYRLQNEVDLALEDLNTAVTLSGGHGRAAEQAFTQRGLIYRLHGSDEQAREDFQAAAKLGSKFAQKQVHICQNLPAQLYICMYACHYSWSR